MQILYKIYRCIITFICKHYSNFNFVSQHVIIINLILNIIPDNLKNPINYFLITKIKNKVNCKFINILTLKFNAERERENLYALFQYISNNTKSIYHQFSSYLYVHYIYMYVVREQTYVFSRL